MHDAVKAMVKDYRDSMFDPQVEADITGYIYHRWLSKYGRDSKWLHLEARLNLDDRPRWHSDLVYGERGKDGRRPYVTPKLVVEIKSFCGFTPDQFAPRKKSLLKDISFLKGDALNPWTKRALVVFLVIDTLEREEEWKRRRVDAIGKDILARIEGTPIRPFLVTGTGRNDANLKS